MSSELDRAAKDGDEQRRGIKWRVSDSIAEIEDIDGSGEREGTCNVSKSSTAHSHILMGGLTLKNVVNR